MGQIIPRLHPHFNQVESLDEMVRSLGFFGLRDRLTAYYLQREVEGRYPEQVNLRRIEDVQKFHQVLQPFSSGDHSRTYLLALFLQLQRWQHDLKLAVPLEVLNNLKGARAKSPQIDWCVLMTWHYGLYLGHRDLNDFIEKKELSYQELWAKLHREQQVEMMSNLLIYGMSIGEEEIWRAALV